VGASKIPASVRLAAAVRFMVFLPRAPILAAGS
jgi:hypothetical protein